MSDTGFGIVGGGWRTEFFLRIAAAVSSMQVTGVVVRNTGRARELQATWQVPVFPQIEDMLKETQPAFVIPSVTQTAMPDVIVDLVKQSVAVLAETPPAPDLDSLIKLYRRVKELNGKVQVAEQFWAQPAHAARLAICHSGRLGPVNQAHVSVCHEYHAMSLIRRFLGIEYECPVIRANKFRSNVIAGPDRNGPPQEDRIEKHELLHAWLDFGDRLGVYEFSLPQYRNWVRGQKLCIRAERGEILDMQVSYMQDYRTPIRGTLLRHEAGQYGNHEGHGLKGIQYLDQMVYNNPFFDRDIMNPPRLNDEEIAIATVLEKMDQYVSTGEEFYSLAEACQDQYLALCCHQAKESGEAIQASSQDWAH